MAKVLYQYDVKTPSPDVDAEAMVLKIRENLPEEYSMQDGTEIKPMFFGIKAAVCQFISPEDNGLQDKLENYLTNLEGVGEFELSFTTRL
ncbi:MAG: Elongation factor 1-beta [Candidatus Heimdallarchaeota archaeon LC_2]|nr:MAG: Elongation factor 1-beta [Candidatus Heimdallarchaeota archaeon LC_2]